MYPYIYLRLAVGKSLAWGLITFDCPWRVHWPHLNLNHRLLESLHLLEGGGLQPEYLRNKKKLKTLGIKGNPFIFNTAFIVNLKQIYKTKKQNNYNNSVFKIHPKYK